MKKKKEILEIRDKNDCLGYMLQIQNKNQECQSSDIIKKMGAEKTLILDDYIKNLQEEGYIRKINLNDIFITEKGQKGYISPIKKIIIKISPVLIGIVGYIMGVLSDDVRDFFHYLFSIAKKLFESMQGA